MLNRLQKLLSILLIGLIITACSEGYKKSSVGTMTFNEIEMDIRDPGSFQIIGDDYAKDNTIAYYRGNAIDKSDGKSFEVLERGYSKDKARVYFSQSYLDGTRFYTDNVSRVTILEGESPEHFVVLDDYFSRGNKHAYSGYTVLFNSHGPSFQSLGGGYGKDRENVYHNFSIMSADAASFTLIDMSYAVDTKMAYYDGMEIMGSDSATFKVLYGNISKDQRHVYDGYKKAVGIDPKSFEFFESSAYAKDKTGIYYMSKRVKGADKASFIANKGSSFAKDKANYYYFGEVLSAGDSYYTQAVEEYK